MISTSSTTFPNESLSSFHKHAAAVDIEAYMRNTAHVETIIGITFHEKRALTFRESPSSYEILLQKKASQR